MVLTHERAIGKLWPAVRLTAYALAACLIVAHPSESRADVWNWLTGLVTTDSETAALSPDELPPGALVTEGGETRVLRLGRDVLELYPRTAVTIEESGPDTSIRLITGTVRVKVAKRKKGQAFNVKTLMLVATVKGTDFEVSATGKGAAVSVYEGRVAVEPTGRVGGIDVTPGKTATVTSTEGAPELGPTPPGGAAAATKAIGRPNAASGDGSNESGGDRGYNKDVKATGRSTSANSSGSSSGGEDGEGDGGEGGEDGGEGGDGEGGEDGDDGDDD